MITMKLDPASMRVLQRALERYAPDVVAAEIKPIIQQTAKDIKKDAVAALRANNSKRSGALIRSVKIGAFQKSKKRGLAWAATGISGDSEEYQGETVIPRKYAHLVERGHIGRHGFVRARPFMGPAADRHMPGCLANIISALQRLLARGASK